jgi:hypothetical protein
MSTIKLFQNKKPLSHRHEAEEQWCFSVVGSTGSPTGWHEES